MLTPKMVDLSKYPIRMPNGWVSGNCFQSDWEQRDLWVMSADMNLLGGELDKVRIPMKRFSVKSLLKMAN